MATRTWNSSGSTDMNDGSNYTPTGAILAGDDLVFDATSVVNATATGSLSVATINALIAYTGTWNDGGQIITVTLTFNMSSGGAFTATGTMDMTSNGNLTFKNTGSVSTSSWTVVLQGTGDFAFIGYRNVYELTCAASGKTTTLKDGSTLYARGTTPLTLGGGTFTLNANLNFAASGYTFTQGSATINGTHALLFGGGGTCTINGCVYTGTGNLWIQSTVAGTNTYNLEGDFTTTGKMYLLSQKTSGATIINSNGYDISTGTTKIMYIGHFVNDDGDITYNLDGSTITAGSLQQYSSSQTDDNTIVNMGDAQIILHNTASDADIIKFYSRVVFTQSTKADSIFLQTNSGKITTAGSIMPSLKMQESTKTWTLQDNYASLNGYGDIRVDIGTLDTNEKVVVCGKDLQIDATEVGDFTASVISIYGDYFSGPTATITIDASTEFKFYGTNTITTNTIAMPKTTLFGDATINDGCTIARLILTDGKTTTFEAGETFTITAYTAADWDGSAGSRTKLRSTIDSTAFTIVMPSDLAMNYVDVKDCTSDTHTMTVTAGIDRTGNTNWVFIGTIINAIYYQLLMGQS